MSQITIGDKTLNFKDSVYTGDQWEQVASWVLNGGGTQIDENVEIAVKKATEAMQSAQAAAASAASVGDIADLSKSYAVGGTGIREGEDTDNAKYYKEQARAIAGGGVTTFNGRGGDVEPQAGDYTKDMVGLGNVDNTSDVDKPVSTAQQAALNGKQAKITTSGILKGDGAGGVSAAVKGTDYAAPSVGVSVTLSASGWDAVAKTQTVSVAGVTATANGSLRIAQSATDEQFTAWGAAQPRVTAQAAGTLTVKVAGTVPTIDIPVEVLIV